jgi:hypothetical protein
MQLCWVVADLEASIHHWVQTCGAGPFFVFDALHFDDAIYRGKAEQIAPCRAAIGQFGDMQIELIQPNGDAPGMWTEITPKGQVGFHHTGLYCEDYEAQRAAYVEAGAVVAFEGLMMGAKVCYIDTIKEIGFFTELITANPVAFQVFKQFRDAAVDWDGRDPIRTLG